MKDGWVKDALNNREERGALLGFVRERMDFNRRMRAWEQGHGSPERDEEEGRLRTEILTVEVGGNEAQRSKATWEYMAKVVACRYDVRHFRERFLDGGVLSPTQARALIFSAAAVSLPAHEFTWSMVESSPSYTLTPLSRNRVSGHGTGEATERPIGLVFPGEDGYAHEVSVVQGSVLDELRKVSVRLSQEYPWQMDQATWFVLTGEPPTVQAVRGSWKIASAEEKGGYDLINMTIQPWVSAETVCTLYKRLQRHMGRGKPRSLSERNLAVFRFVVEQLEVRSAETDGVVEGELPLFEPELVRPSWRILLQRWNYLYPVGHDWHYKSVQNFARDFRRVHKAVALPPRFGRPYPAELKWSNGSSSGSNRGDI